MGESEKNNSIILPFVVSIVAISFAAIFVKWSHAPATVLSMHRMWLASLLMLPIIWKKREEFIKISRKEWLFLFFSGFFLALHFALWFGSLKLTTVASSTIILALQPIISLIGGFIIYKERTTKSAVITMIIAIIGVMFIGWGDFGLSAHAILGDLLSFLSVIAVVGYLLIGQNTVKKISHWLYSFSVFTFAAIFLSFYNVITNEVLFNYEAKEWGIFLLLAIVPTISHIINNWLLNFVSATTISMSILGEPVGATILAVILLGEKLSNWQVFGGIIVLIGVFIFLREQNNKQKLMIQSVKFD